MKKAKLDEEDRMKKAAYHRAWRHTGGAKLEKARVAKPEVRASIRGYDRAYKGRRLADIVKKYS